MQIGNFFFYFTRNIYIAWQNVWNLWNIIPQKVNPLKLNIILEKYLCRKLILVILHPSDVILYYISLYYYICYVILRYKFRQIPEKYHRQGLLFSNVASWIYLSLILFSNIFQKKISHRYTLPATLLNSKPCLWHFSGTCLNFNCTSFSEYLFNIIVFIYLLINY